jgi:ribosome recycling factor
MVEEYLTAMMDDFSKVIDAFKGALNTVRTGRASPQLIDGLMIDVASYGAKMPLNQIASISAPDARLLVVNPWDKATMNDIEKGIRSAALGLNPSNDGQIIRVPIPPLTGERRKGLVKMVRQLTEDARIRARQVRRDYNDIFKEMESEKDISEDESRKLTKQVQDSTNDCIELLESISKDKEKEVQEV